MSYSLFNSNNILKTKRQVGKQQEILPNGLLGDLTFAVYKFKRVQPSVQQDLLYRSISCGWFYSMLVSCKYSITIIINIIYNFFVAH